MRPHQQAPAGALRATSTLQRLAAACLLAVACQAGAGPGPADPRVAQAKELIDAVDVDRMPLRDAAELLAKVLQATPDSIEAHLQVARIAVKAGIDGDRMRPGSLEAAEFHLQAVLKQDPDRAAALSQLGEVRLLQDRMPEALGLLLRARAIDPDNPWIRINLAHYYEEIGNLLMAHEEYADVVAWGPVGPRTDQSLAYPLAAVGYAERRLGRGAAEIRRLAASAEQARKTGPAYVPRAFSRLFVRLGEFDDAIAQARRAHALDGRFDGRQALGNALYGKAAQLQLQGQPGVAELVREAEALRTNPGLTLCAFLSAQPEVRARMVPVVRELLPSPDGPARPLYAQSGCRAAMG